ncbi:hypothetical protein P171DRAFT_111486 [Karstenula rhodostoma CBS 690.94]|uniref:Uncharacterized protein n=1 Tax=Karstenula rhodostoma CBS 690.94 TaxID=1392251 RepID=A0A9P4PAU0_9PLEO|nr:hypothetical protein P171DRAFT_111486 [Karstenula rhodostoma CBS 690.94]
MPLFGAPQRRMEGCTWRDLLDDHVSFRPGVQCRKRKAGDCWTSTWQASRISNSFTAGHPCLRIEVAARNPWRRAGSAGQQPDMPPSCWLGESSLWRPCCASRGRYTVACHRVTRSEVAARSRTCMMQPRLETIFGLLMRLAMVLKLGWWVRGRISSSRCYGPSLGTSKWAPIGPGASTR